MILLLFIEYFKCLRGSTVDVSQKIHKFQSGVPSSLVFLSGLSIDYSANKLYWISAANGTINRCNLDGSGLEVLETLKRQLAKGTALAVMGEWSLSQVHQIAIGD